MNGWIQKSTWSVFIPVWLEPEGSTNFPMGSMDFLMSRRLRISSFNFSRIAMDGATVDWVDRDCKPVNVNVDHIGWWGQDKERKVGVFDMPNPYRSKIKSFHKSNSIIWSHLWPRSPSLSSSLMFWSTWSTAIRLKFQDQPQPTCCHTSWASFPSCWCVGAAAAAAWQPPAACHPSCSCRSQPPALWRVTTFDQNHFRTHLALIHPHCIFILSISHTLKIKGIISFMGFLSNLICSCNYIYW